MANFFDQFDETPPDFGDRPNFANFFDQFDPDPAVTGGPPIPEPIIPDMRGRAPTAGEEVLEGFEGFSQGVIDPINAGAQMLSRALPESIAQPISEAGEAIGMAPGSPEAIDKSIIEQERARQFQRGPDAGVDLPRLGGNIAGTLPAALAPATLPGAVGAGVGVGLAQPVVSPEEQQNFAETKGMQALLGAAGGVGGNILGRGVARVVNPKTRQAVKDMIARNVTPTPGQVVGGGLGRFEEKLMSVPVLGDVIGAGRRRAVREFNTAIFDDILKPIGATAPRKIGREGVEAVGDAIGKGYDDILPGLTMKVDQQLIDDVAQLRSAAAELPPELAKRFESVLQNRVVGQLARDTGGKSFKRVESALTDMSKRFGKSTDAFQQELGENLNGLLGALRGNLARSNAGVKVNIGGELVDAGQRVGDLNTAWAKLVRLEKAAGMAGAADGVFTPAQFSSAVRAADQSTRKRAFARGSALMQDISDPGKAVLGGTVPDSGTAGRLLPALLASGATAGAIANPVATAAVIGGAGASMLPYTKLGQKLAAALLARRPAAAAPIAQGIRAAVPALQVGGAAAAANR